MSRPATATVESAEVARTSAATPAARPPAQVRLALIDSYRGFVVLLMMAEALRFKAVSRALPDSGFWDFLTHHQSHSAWVGCTLHDLIQPSFTFLVGVAQ
jgi:heparan-alpha-glucosaminide N-acetyltransferase